MRRCGAEKVSVRQRSLGLHTWIPPWTLSWKGTVQSLCKDEWTNIQDDVNRKFGELLTVAFPENHFRLNCAYLKRKGDGKPP